MTETVTPQPRITDRRRLRPQPLIAVTDVQRSSAWYQRLLGCRSAHGGDEYERLESEGLLVLQLHASRSITSTG